MITVEVDIPDEVAMELNAHIAMFKSKMGIDVKLNELVASALIGYLIEHANDIEDYRIAHEPPKRQHCNRRCMTLPTESGVNYYVEHDVECPFYKGYTTDGGTRDERLRTTD